MQVESSRCLVFEDAPLGIEAARRAGMTAVAITSTLDAAALGTSDHVIAARAISWRSTRASWPREMNAATSAA